MCLNSNLAVVVASLIVATPCFAASDGAGLAVFDIEDRGAGKTVASNLTEIVTRTLGDLGVFNVTSRAEVVSMLQLAQEQQLLGCARDDQCASELGGALGVQLLVTGSIGKVGERLLLSLTLSDSREGKVLAREQREIADTRLLLAETESTAKLLVRSLLAGAQGFAVFRVSEEAADIEVDGKIVGSTPMGRYALASGPHRVRVLKASFVAWSQDITVQRNQTTVVDATLVPSVEFIQVYDERAASWRRWAWIAGGVGVAALGYGAYTYFVVNERRASEFNRDALRDNCNADTRFASQVDCTIYSRERSSIERADVISSVGMGLGALGIATAVYLFTQGPAPGAYDLYKPDVRVDVALGKHPGVQLTMALP